MSTIARSAGPLRITRSCPEVVGLERLQENCAIAGHWIVDEHELRNRTIGEWVLIFCVGGRGWLELGSRRYEIVAGDLFACPPDRPHGYGCESPGGWEIWWCHTRGAQAGKLCGLAGLGEQQPVIRIRQPQTIVARYADLVERLARPDATVAWDAAGHLHQLLVELVRQEGQAPSTDNLAVFADLTCRSLDDMVRRSGYSKFHFCRQFRAQTGRSPWKYLLERKVERARELLLSTRLSIKEIAAELGFHNADYFAKLFRQQTGVTPKAYRGRA